MIADARLIGRRSAPGGTRSRVEVLDPLGHRYVLAFSRRCSRRPRVVARGGAVARGLLARRLLVGAVLDRNWLPVVVSAALPPSARSTPCLLARRGAAGLGCTLAGAGDRRLLGDRDGLDLLLRLDPAAPPRRFPAAGRGSGADASSSRPEASARPSEARQRRVRARRAPAPPRPRVRLRSPSPPRQRASSAAARRACRVVCASSSALRPRHLRRPARSLRPPRSSISVSASSGSIADVVFVLGSRLGRRLRLRTRRSRRLLGLRLERDGRRRLGPAGESRERDTVEHATDGDVHLLPDELRGAGDDDVVAVHLADPALTSWRPTSTSFSSSVAPSATGAGGRYASSLPCPSTSK